MQPLNAQVKYHSDMTLAELGERLGEYEYAGQHAQAEDVRFEIANRGHTVDEALEAWRKEWRKVQASHD